MIDQFRIDTKNFLDFVKQFAKSLTTTHTHKHKHAWEH